MNSEIISYTTVYTEGKGEITEKKSRFLSFVYAVETEEEIQQILEGFRKTYWDARHVCYAYVLHDNPLRLKFSDDGEPQGTAGKPMLELLMRKNLQNVLLIVVRYFGGVLLGTGGLVRAYTDSSVMALENAKYMTKTLGYLTKFRLDYSLSGKMPNLLSELGLFPESINYLDAVEYTIPVPTVDFIRFQKSITELTSGSVIPTEGELVYFSVIDGECVVLGGTK